MAAPYTRGSHRSFLTGIHGVKGIQNRPCPLILLSSTILLSSYILTVKRCPSLAPVPPTSLDEQEELALVNRTQMYQQPCLLSLLPRWNRLLGELLLN